MTNDLPHSTKTALQVILDGLSDIQDHFVWEDFAPEVQIASAEASHESDVDDEDSNPYDRYEETFETPGYDKEDVEVAVDQFLSSLVRKGLITKDEKGRVPSFSGVFDALLGRKHEISKHARDFEDHVRGYFGWIQYEKMKSAYEALSGIKSALEEALGNAACD